MRFGRKVDDGTRLVLRQQAIDQGAVTDVALHEDMARVALQAGQVVQVAGIGELVEVDDALRVAGKPVEYEVGADETGASGDEDHGMNQKCAEGKVSDYPTAPCCCS